MAWVCGTLKTFKTLKSIKIVKQHAPKWRLLRGIKVSGFLLFNDKKMKRVGVRSIGGLRAQTRKFTLQKNRASEFRSTEEVTF